MSSNTATINSLFKKLHVVYLRRWIDFIGTAPIEAVKAEWETELAEFSHAHIADALVRMRGRYKEWPPSLYQFRDLCIEARAVERGAQPKLMPPKVSPPPGVWEKVRAAIKKLDATPGAKE